jgi:hypothetical protein
VSAPASSAAVPPAPPTFPICCRHTVYGKEGLVTHYYTTLQAKLPDGSLSPPLHRRVDPVMPSDGSVPTVGTARVESD